MSAPHRFDRGHTDDLMSFLAASPSPYHAVANTAERLEKAGFRQVAETDAWDAETSAGSATGSGGKYVLRGGAIVAWYVPEGAAPHTPSGSSAPTPTPPTCASSRSPTSEDTAGARSPWRSTADRCSTPGSTATSAWPAASPSGTAPRAW